MSIHHFLLVFDHKKATLLDVHDFGVEGGAAGQKYREAEVEHRDNPNIDIVLIGSDSLDTVRLTHANYFDGTASVSKYLAGLTS